ncbi:MAG TPA: amidohydrolase, partial [Erythrobacter sp.]|nr:amidohydrolase [Erythrobacter sp.]
SEGTWMDVDVSPDGKSIAFALLGDIYTMPITGGTPTRIAEGLAWEVQPRFSPDGSRIAFTSDRGGADNIWVMNADGLDKRQVTKEDFRLLNQPSWSPDGRFIVAKKHFTTQRSAGTGEIWMYHVSGGGGVQLTERPNPQFQKEIGEPIFAPDGSAVYFTRNTTPGNAFIYAQDSNAGIFAIERYDIASGEVTTAVSGFGGAVRATPSPDGKSIAFVRRDKDQSQLWVKDIASGAERMVYGHLDLDMQETWAVYGVYPNMDWTPDSQSIVFWAGGKLKRIGADGAGLAEIPFTVSDTRGVADAPHPVIEVSPDSFTTAMPRFATLSPDGNRVVFEGMGRLYTKSARGGDAPARLTRDSSDTLELWPAYSRDGKKLAYVRWNDERLGEIVVADANGRNPRVVTSQPGHYAVPQFSPDGATIVFEKREGGYLTAPEYSEIPGIYTVPAAGGAMQLVSRDGSDPHFGADNDRIFMSVNAGGKLALVSTHRDGEDRRTHAQGELANDFRVSPDGRTVAFRQNYEVFAMPLMPGGKPVDVNEKGGALPVTRVSKGGADYIGWSRDGALLNWSIGPEVRTAETAQFFRTSPKGKDDKGDGFTPPEAGIPIGLTIEAAKPTGTLVLIGARVLTMAGDGAGAIDNATIVIEGDRITAVGPTGALTVP